MGASFQACLRTLYRHQSTIIDLQQYRSEKIMLGRGVRQGCMLSPLLFALPLEPLASVISHDKEVKAIQGGTEEAKLALYADDTVSFLEHPLISITKLCSFIEQFGIVSGYNINKEKPRLLGV